MNKINDKAIAFLPIETIEPAALSQIENLSELPFVFKHVAVMPDAHMGKGACVGTVVPTKGAIIPAAVGVDIGCGMISVKTNLKYNEAWKLGVLKEIRAGIERRIPMSAGKFNNKFTESALKRIEKLEHSAAAINMEPNIFSPNWREQLGTLGGGNHFIEICVDEENTIWVTLHSGSRGIGNKIGVHYIELAKTLMKDMHIQLKDPDLAYFPESIATMRRYILDMNWAQDFAMANREEMMDRVMAQIAENVLGDYKKASEMEVERINCHHNFTQEENHFGENIWVTRKGSISAAEGVKGMIPGSMGTKSYIVSGLGNKMSFNSAPHGAGRNFSRGEAKKRFTMEDMDKAMEGIEYRRSDAFLDEIPGAYKDIETVMENAKELVKIDHILKQILNCKGE